LTTEPDTPSRLRDRLRLTRLDLAVPPRTITDFESQYETIDEFEAATAHLTHTEWEATFDADDD
jgi:hypothetical protein